MSSRIAKEDASGTAVPLAGLALKFACQTV
jgi:hypothetical protein